jgi:hypothetical protein
VSLPPPFSLLPRLPTHLAISPGIADNLKTIKLSAEDMDTLNSMAEKEGKQKRVNTPLFGWSLGFHDWYGVGNKDAPSKDAVDV